jgi:hypothetical protein
VLGACSPPAPDEATDEAIVVPGSGTHADFLWTLEPAEDSEKIKRLEAYVTRYDPDPDGYEDAVHVRYYRVAQYRLLQLYYRTGMIEAADALLAQLESTDADIK